MSWVSPRTWVTDEIVTAAGLNEQLRDNTTYLKNRLEDANVELYKSTSNFSYTGVVPAAAVTITGASITLTPRWNRVRIMITTSSLCGGAGSAINLHYNINGGASVKFTEYGTHGQSYHILTVMAYATVTAGVSTTVNAMVFPFDYTGSSTTTLYGITMIVEDLVNV